MADGSSLFPLAMLGMQGQGVGDQAFANQQVNAQQQQAQQQKMQQLLAAQLGQAGGSFAPTMSPTDVLARAIQGGLAGALWNRAQPQGGGNYQLPAAQNPFAGTGGSMPAGNMT